MYLKYIGSFTIIFKVCFILKRHICRASPLFFYGLLISGVRISCSHPMRILCLDETWERVTQSQVYYTESYLLTSPDGPACMEALANEAIDENKVLLTPFRGDFWTVSKNLYSGHSHFDAIT